MDLSKLNGLSTDTLNGMKSHIETILAARFDTRMAPGRIATYEYNGVMHTTRIESVNSKTCTCVEISPVAGRKVRVGITMLKVSPIERKTQMDIKATPTKHKPVSVVGDSW